MTTPFRRRHHDDESAHDRARALTATEMLESLDELQSVWLAGHLEVCAECRNDREAYLADRALLRGLREHAPEPPRDLRARTMASLDREALARSRRGRASVGREPGRRPAMPFGAAAGALIVLVVVGATVMQQVFPNSGPEPARSQSAFGTVEPQTTPFDVPATAVNDVGWIQPGADGSWELVLADVTSLCPRTRPSCKPLGEDESARRVELGSVPHSLTISPTETQLVVETRGSGGGHVFVVSLPPEPVDPSAAPTDGPTPLGTPSVTGPDATPGQPTDTPTSRPTDAPISPLPSSGVPRGAVEIAAGVSVVGETLYSPDGAWLAFSARPSDGSRGPDLYLWRVGDPTATVVTDDHATYFSTWYGGSILASHVSDPSASAGASAPPDPSATPTEADLVSAVPTSFLLDPATLTRTPIDQPNVWLPVVDPSGRFVAYWSGTLTRATPDADWQPGEGSLVLATWSDGTTPEPTASSDPGATDAPAPLGPAGEPSELVPGPMAAFRTNFDPDGLRLAIWVGETTDGDVGRLHLVVLDAATGGIDPTITPLPGVPALRRFSIDKGRLAWVTPSGQDGQDSSVQVLGWSGDEFGEMHGLPAKQMYLVR